SELVADELANAMEPVSFSCAFCPGATSDLRRVKPGALWRHSPALLRGLVDSDAIEGGMAYHHLTVQMRVQLVEHFAEPRRASHTILRDAMNIDILASEVVLWIYVGLPLTGQTAV